MKPHLKRYGSGWQCSNHWAKGYGSNPTVAFVAWLKQLTTLQIARVLPAQDWLTTETE